VLKSYEFQKSMWWNLICIIDKKTDFGLEENLFYIKVVSVFKKNSILNAELLKVLL
jgi:hypothetical protein